MFLLFFIFCKQYQWLLYQQRRLKTEAHKNLLDIYRVTREAVLWILSTENYILTEQTSRPYRWLQRCQEQVASIIISQLKWSRRYLLYVSYVNQYIAYVAYILGMCNFMHIILYIIISIFLYDTSLGCSRNKRISFSYFLAK